MDNIFEPPLPERYRKTHKFFDPENLEKLIIKYEGEAVLLVVDAQKEFADPWYGRGNTETVEVAERLQSIIPQFRRAGVPVYAIYYSTSGEKALHHIDFFKFHPAPEDKLFAKSTNSAFDSGKLRAELEKEKRRLLLVCGFNEAACVKETVLSARQLGYDVCVMEDLAGNDNYALNFRMVMSKLMDEKGAAVTTSDHVLKFLRKHHHQPREPKAS